VRYGIGYDFLSFANALASSPGLAVLCLQLQCQAHFGALAMLDSRLSLALSIFALSAVFTLNSWGPAEDSSAAELQEETKGALAEKSTANSEEAQRNPESPESSRVAALQVIDRMIDICKRMGDSENSAELQKFRSVLCTSEDHKRARVLAANAFEFIQALRLHSEPQSAQALAADALRLAAIVKKEDPLVFIALHQEAAELDIAFERYDSALKNISTALKVAKDEPMDRHDLIAVRATRAMVLRKMKRFDESEQAYRELIREAKNQREEISKDDLPRLQFALAALYCDKGAFTEYAKIVPNSYRDGAIDWEGKIVQTTAYVNYRLSIGRNIDRAADKAQELAEGTQKAYGVLSREHIEAIELLAKVRIAQSQYDEAVKLLRKSVKLRSVLLGESHPSIARVNKVIDDTRKKS
jgi:tetratricopeptide (TPR) repeat protein